MDVVEKVVDYVEAFTLGMGCYTDIFEEHIAEMVGSQAEDDMEGCKAKQEVQARMEECRCTKIAQVHFDCCYSWNKVHLAYPVDMTEGLEAFSG